MTTDPTTVRKMLVLVVGDNAVNRLVATRVLISVASRRAPSGGGSPHVDRPQRGGASVIGNCQRTWHSCCMWCGTPMSGTDRSCSSTGSDPQQSPTSHQHRRHRTTTATGHHEHVPL